tara:strand:+ start:894 stop:1127 length:234 start_codon:yes stop_codon:yes gene_type:complete
MNQISSYSTIESKLHDENSSKYGMKGAPIPLKEKIRIIPSPEMLDYMYTEFNQYYNPTEDRPTIVTVKTFQGGIDEE